MVPEFTVTEVNAVFRSFVSETFHNIKVRGEVSGLLTSKSGHRYFTLKDDQSVLAAVCWRGAPLRHLPVDGLEVVCYGSFTTYQSKYQLSVEDIQISGVGVLQKLFEKKKQELEISGLFDPKKKKLLPLFPKIIGVITSPTGAVINDIISRVKSRFPIHLIIWPVSVQGTNSVKEIVKAIAGFNEMVLNKPDVLILARGGGSLEDLWSFNEEEIVRSIAASDIPLISAIGHESDFTLADYAADVRAETPTAAVEIALSTTKEQINRLLTEYSQRILHAVNNLLNQRRSVIVSLKKQLQKPKYAINLQQARLYALKIRMQLLIKRLLSAKFGKLNELHAKLLQHDQDRILKKGYAIIYKNEKLTNDQLLTKGDKITIEWITGQRTAIIE